MTVNIDQKVGEVTEPAPTLLVTMKETGQVGEIYLVIEGVNFQKVREKETPIALLAAFYAFNIIYPKHLVPF